MTCRQHTIAVVLVTLIALLAWAACGRFGGGAAGLLVLAGCLILLLALIELLFWLGGGRRS